MKPILLLLLQLIVCPFLNAQNQDISDCTSKRRILEKELFFSCPLFAGADSALRYLDRRSDFVKNNEYQYSQGARKYGFKDARFSGCPIQDNSFFFLNITDSAEGRIVFLLDALYYFESPADQQRQVARLEQLFEKDMALSHKTFYDAEGNPYERYFLPCAAFNFKTGVPGNDPPLIRIQIER